jgi:nucleoside-diphosphate-sugar epimerase
MIRSLFCFGLGYCALALGDRLQKKGWRIAGTATATERVQALRARGYDAYLFDGERASADVKRALASATHVLLSIPPDGDGDPAYRVYGDALGANVSWIGYFSSVSVYGDAEGDWVDETTIPDPASERGQRRLKAESEWLGLGNETNKTTVIFRLPGIYGPGRSAIDQLRAGTARRIFKPGQVTNRVHVDDIATAVEAAFGLEAGPHVYNVTDDLPAPPQDVIAYGAELLSVPCPPPTDISDPTLSATARSFYAESKRVSNARMKRELGVQLAYPTYVEGLRAIAQDAPHSF